MPQPARRFAFVAGWGLIGLWAFFLTGGYMYVVDDPRDCPSTYYGEFDWGEPVEVLQYSETRYSCAVDRGEGYKHLRIGEREGLPSTVGWLLLGGVALGVFRTKQWAGW